jgi:hypothetical protein
MAGARVVQCTLWFENPAAWTPEARKNRCSRPPNRPSCEIAFSRRSPASHLMQGLAWFDLRLRQFAHEEHTRLTQPSSRAGFRQQCRCSLTSGRKRSGLGHCTVKPAHPTERRCTCGQDAFFFLENRNFAWGITRRQPAVWLLFFRRTVLGMWHPGSVRASSAVSGRNFAADVEADVISSS